MAALWQRRSGSSGSAIHGNLSIAAQPRRSFCLLGSCTLRLGALEGFQLLPRIVSVVTVPQYCVCELHILRQCDDDGRSTTPSTTGSYDALRAAGMQLRRLAPCDARHQQATSCLALCSWHSRSSGTIVRPPASALNQHISEGAIHVASAGRYEKGPPMCRAVRLLHPIVTFSATKHAWPLPGPCATEAED